MGLGLILLATKPIFKIKLPFQALTKSDTNQNSIWRNKIVGLVTLPNPTWPMQTPRTYISLKKHLRFQDLMVK